ncbi:hypothetical protein Tco_0217166 [Tanacetum coccineum]
MISSISVGGSISSEGFLSSILLVVVIIVMVVIVVVILIVIVVAIVGVVIVVMIFGVVVVVDDVSLIFKLSFVIIGTVFLLGLLALAIVSACAFRAEEMPLVMSCWMLAKVMAGVSDVDVLLEALSIREHGMIHNDDRTGVIDANDGDDDEREIRSNSSDGGNTGDGVKIAGEVIGSGGEIGFSEELKELLPAEGCG